MRAFYLAWTDGIPAQPAQVLDGPNLPQVMAENLTKRMETLPAGLKARLPTIAQLERELGGGKGKDDGKA